MSNPLQLVTRLQYCVGEGEFLLQMVDVNVAVECLCFQIRGMMEAFGVQGLTGMNLATMQAAGLGGITGIPGLIDTLEHVCIKMQGLPYNATQRDNEFL